MALGAALCAALFSRSGLVQAVKPTILQIDVANNVLYDEDVSDISEFATNPSVGTDSHSAKNFNRAVGVADIVALNGQSAKAAFPKGFKAHKSMIPASGPATPAEGRIRLETAYQKFDEACRRIGADGRVVTSAFGSVPAQDFVRFNELHTRHHSKQMAARQ